MTSIKVLDRLYPGKWALLLTRLAGPRAKGDAPGKRPLGRAWNSQALARWENGEGRAEHLAAMANHRGRGDNVGLTIPPGVVALDADTPEAAHWCRKNFEGAPQQETAHGCHFLLRVPIDIEIPATCKVTFAPGVVVDVRSAGRAQLVVEPSVHVTGAEYRWKRRIPASFEKIPPCPANVLDTLTHVAGAKPNGRGSGRIPKGERNDSLFRQGCAMRGRGRSRAEIAAELHEVNARHCEPPLNTREVHAIVESVLNYVPGEASADDAGSKPFLPLDDLPRPAFPTDALPETLRNYVEALAESTQTPVDMSAACVIGALATVRGGKTRVQIAEDYTEPTNVWFLSVAKPGERKSSVFAAASAPLRAIEKRKAAQAMPQIEHGQAKIRRLETQITQLEKDASKDDALAEAFRLTNELAELKANTRDCPRLIVDDCTPEMLAELLSQNGERMALWSPEGGEAIEMMLGRYSANRRPNLGVYLYGHAGDPINVDRRSGTKIRLDQPALTIVATCQPGVLHDLRESPRLRERGLLARFLLIFPDSRLGERICAPAPMSREVAERYAALLERLEGPELWDAPQRLLRLGKAARRVRDNFANEIEPQLAEGASLVGISDWAGKLPGLAVRIAGLLHEAEHAPDGPISVGADTMSRGVKIARWALAHALACFAEIELEEGLAIARKCWRWISKRGLAEVDDQAVWQGCKGGRIHGRTDLDAGIQRLIEHGYLKRSTTGRKRYEVRPEALPGGKGR